MKRVLVLSTLCIFLSVSLSGCGVWRAYKDFSYRIGEKMPTWGDTPRCEGRAFCFGDSPPPERSPARSQDTGNGARATANPMPQNGAFPTPQMPAQMKVQPAGNSRMQSAMPPTQQNGYGGQAMPNMQQAPANTHNAANASANNYSNPSQQGWTPPANWDPANIGRSATKGASGGGTEADAAYNEMRAQAGLAPIAEEEQAPPVYQSAPLKPHEEHPEWKYKMDESPYNELIRSIDSDNRGYHGF